MNATASALSGRRIPVVEDAFFLAADLVGDLERHGAEIVGPVAIVENALALVRETGRLDGAVLDINLQGEMVYPVADALELRSDGAFHQWREIRSRELTVWPATRAW